MKKSCESNNINIFDDNFENINKDYNYLSIQKYFLIIIYLVRWREIKVTCIDIYFEEVD
jgi:hypothetical protein